MPDNVDGSLSLDTQANTLNFYQQQNNCKVTDYKKGDGGAIQNVVTSQTVSMGVCIPNLQLVVIPAGKSATDVQPAHMTLTFANIIFVNGVQTNVAGFHG